MEICDHSFQWKCQFYDVIKKKKKKRKERSFFIDHKYFQTFLSSKDIREKNSYKAKLPTRLPKSEGEPGRNTAMKNDVHGQTQNWVVGAEIHLLHRYCDI